MPEMNLTPWLESMISLAPRVLLFFVVLLAGWIVAGWAQRIVRRGLMRTQFDVTLTKFLSGLTRWGILILVFIALLGYLGVATASFAAVIGAAGLAIGLAFQGSLSNFAAGTMLLLFRPFKVGDFVTAGGETGIVDEIDLFVTKLDTLDHRRIIVPNSAIASNVITNITHHPIRRVDVPVGTAYGADLATVRQVLETVPARVEGALADPAPQIFLSELGESSINWQVRVWCNTPDYWDVWQRTTHETKMRLDEAGISIPFPQRDVHLFQPKN